MPIERVVFASFAPDSDPNNPSLIIDSDNIFPTLRGFKNLPDPAENVFGPLTDFSSPARGAYMATDVDGSNRVFAATSKNSSGTDATDNGAFHEADKAGGQFGSTWSTVTPRAYGTGSPADLAVDVPRDHRVVFSTHGDLTLAAYGDEGYFIFDPEEAGVGGRFQKVPLTAAMPTDSSITDWIPAPRFVVSTGEHVVLFNFASGDSNMGISLNETSWWCSNSGSATLFRDDNVTTTNSNAGYLDDTPGPIIGAKSFGRDVLVYKQRSMHKLEWTGEQNVVFRNVVLSERAGALSNEAVVDIGDRQVFLGYDDFYFSSGGAPETINNGVRDFLFGTDGNLDKEFSFAVQAYFDRARNTVFWFYPIVADAQRRFDPDDPILCRGYVAWNVSTDKWTHGTNGLGGKPVVQVVLPEVIPSSSLGLSYGNFGSQSDLYAAGAALTWNTDFVEDGASIQYNQSSIIGSPEYSPGAFVSDPDPAAEKSSLFSAGISAFTSFDYGGSEDGLLQENQGKIVTGCFGDGLSYTFVRGIRPRFVGDKPPTRASIQVWSKADLSVPIFPTDAEEAVVHDAAVADRSLYNFSSELDVYSSDGEYTSTSKPLSPRSPQWFPLRVTGRYVQFVFSFRGEAELMGFDIDYDTTGTR